MAMVYGGAGDHCHRVYRTRMAYYFVGLVGLGYVLMLAVGFLAGTRSLWGILPLLVAIAPARILLRKLDAYADRMRSYRRGATGEEMTAAILEDLPDAFWVFHGFQLAGQQGDIDHVVIGPTGIYVLETKDWRGVVGFSPAGQLQCNGEGRGPDAARTTAVSAELAKRLHALTGQDVWVQACMVFTRAWIEQSGVRYPKVDLRLHDKLEEYLTAPRSSRSLDGKQVRALAEAASSLLKHASLSGKGGVAAGDGAVAPASASGGAGAPAPGDNGANRRA